MQKMVYIESVLLDTNIFDDHSYEILSNQTLAIEQEYSISDRMLLRKERIETFMNYLLSVENLMVGDKPSLKDLELMKEIKNSVMLEFDRALMKIERK